MLTVYLLTSRATTLGTLRERLASSLPISPILGDEFLVAPDSPEWIRITELDRRDFEVPSRYSQLRTEAGEPRCFEIQHHDLALLEMVLSNILDNSIVVDDEYGNIDTGANILKDVSGYLSRYWKAVQSSAAELRREPQ